MTLNKPTNGSARSSESVAHKNNWLQREDVQATGLLVFFMLLGLLLIPSSSTWVTLTLAGIAMGLMIFVMTSGFTLVFTR